MFISINHFDIGFLRSLPTHKEAAICLQASIQRIERIPLSLTMIVFSDYGLNTNCKAKYVRAVLTPSKGFLKDMQQEMILCSQLITCVIARSNPRRLFLFYTCDNAGHYQSTVTPNRDVLTPKILERLVFDRCINYINDQEILNDKQYGFRPKHSTYMTFAQLVDKITNAVEKK